MKILRKAAVCFALIFALALSACGAGARRHAPGPRRRRHVHAGAHSRAHAHARPRQGQGRGAALRHDAAGEALPAHDSPPRGPHRREPRHRRGRDHPPRARDLPRRRAHIQRGQPRDSGADARDDNQHAVLLQAPALHQRGRGGRQRGPAHVQARHHLGELHVQLQG